MKRLAAILVVTAAITGAAPMAAIAASGSSDSCSSTWPVNLRLIPYC